MMATGEEAVVVLTQSFSSAEVTVENYLQEAVQPRELSPRIYWEEKKILYPLLAKLAMKHLSIPATSVASERSFGTARHIISDQRNCLDPDRAEMLLFLNKNLHLLIDSK